MEITIKAETDAEKKVLPDAWILGGCVRFGLSGICERTDKNATGEFGFMHGDGVGIRGDVARLVAALDVQAMHNATVNGLLNAQQILANAQRDQALANEIRNGKPFKLHRP